MIFDITYISIVRVNLSLRSLVSCMRTALLLQLYTGWRYNAFNIETCAMYDNVPSNSWTYETMKFLKEIDFVDILTIYFITDCSQRSDTP